MVIGLNLSGRASGREQLLNCGLSMTLNYISEQFPDGILQKVPPHTMPTGVENRPAPASLFKLITTPGSPVQSISQWRRIRSRRALVVRIFAKSAGGWPRFPFRRDENLAGSEAFESWCDSNLESSDQTAAARTQNLLHLLNRCIILGT